MIQCCGAVYCYARRFKCFFMTHKLRRRLNEKVEKVMVASEKLGQQRFLPLSDLRCVKWKSDGWKTFCFCFLANVAAMPLNFAPSGTFLVILLVLKLVCQTCEAQSVQLEQGTLRGVSRTVRGRTVFSFLGIPYGEAPIGERRFKTAQSHKGWSVRKSWNRV